MSPIVSANQRKAVLKSLGIVRPVIVGESIRYGVRESLATCCGCVGLKGRLPHAKVSGFLTAFTDVDTVPEVVFPESLLIPDEKLNCLIQWEDL